MVWIEKYNRRYRLVPSWRCYADGLWSSEVGDRQRLDRIKGLSEEVKAVVDNLVGE